MKNSEFSDTFTTLLNSYNTQASFGEQASKREIVLDEYEKSVLLTQAQDITIKSYFDGTLNQQGQGFDDSTRRQMDFSSLIKVADLVPISEEDSAKYKFDERGLIYQLPRKKISKSNMKEEAAEGTYIAITGDDNNVLVNGTTDVLFILNEKLTAKTIIAIDPDTGEKTYNNGNKGKEYVIVPINYKEYDREMSKPYAQPLKKQAWRLFQNQQSGFDINSELIPKWNVTKSSGDAAAVGDTEFIYRIRYVKRPRPIILEDMPNELEIDGETKFSECELNPIIHMDILNKAVELAIATRGGGVTSDGSGNVAGRAGGR